MMRRGCYQSQFSVQHRMCRRRIDQFATIATATHRAGLTLLEVLVSTAIFMAALTAILGIMQLGHESRLSAQLDADAALRCEALLGEYVSGMRPLNAVSNELFEDDESWRYSVLVDDGGGESLLRLTVVVEHAIGENNPNSSFQLVRLMRDPQLFLDAAMSAETSE